MIRFKNRWRKIVVGVGSRTFKFGVVAGALVAIAIGILVANAAAYSVHPLALIAIGALVFVIGRFALAVHGLSSDFQHAFWTAACCFGASLVFCAAWLWIAQYA